MNTQLRIALLIIVSALIAAFFIFDLDQYANLSYIKQQQEAWQSFYTDNQVLVIALFASIYIAATALSLPAAALLTLLSGALFGVLLGTIIASFASTIGATLAFMLARFLAKDFIQSRYQDQLHKINQGFQQEGAFYLFAMRLVPVFPFFLVNVVMALLPIRPLTFYWVSQLGMLPGTAVYVYAGTQLAQLDSLGGILSPQLLIAFGLLGVFPLLAKKVVELLRRKQIHGKI